MSLHGGGQPEIKRSAEYVCVHVVVGLYSRRLVFVIFLSPPSKCWNSNFSLHVTKVTVRITYCNIVTTECFEQPGYHHGFIYYRTFCFEIIIISLYVISLFKRTITATSRRGWPLHELYKEAV